MTTARADDIERAGTDTSDDNAATLKPAPMTTPVTAPQARPGPGRWWVWAGVTIAAVGFALVAVAWGQAAGETEVYLQVPYVVSAGFGGLGLVMVGLAVLDIGVRKNDAAERDQRLKELTAILADLQSDASTPGDREH